MRIFINGEEKNFQNDKTLKEILKELNIEEKVMAIAVNMEIVKKDNWSKFVPKDGDKIEMLTFVAGG
ncbi:MAG TPA: sulfur carrier protein ThiS [Campylobacterales bacterium]|nr:sulfur carrier protein ThiS [Campylobacterales bacterium]